MPNANTANLAPPALPLRVRIRKAALFTAAMGAFGWLLVSAHVPCGFAAVFHMPCPGCGSTRAMLALGRGDLASYLRFNPLAPLMSLLVGVLVLSALHSVVTTGTFRGLGAGRLGIFLARGAAVVAAFEFALWVARFAGLFGGPVPV